jgi:enterochelin esterase-like enzyme
MLSLAPLLLLAAAPPSSPAETVIGPDYADAPEMAANPAQPRGDLHSFVMRSQDSRIYPGIRRVENAVTARRDAYGNRLAAPFDQESEAAPYERQVQVYVPAQYKPGMVVPFMVVQDGPSYGARVAAALDSLIAQHRVPVMVAIMIQSGGGDAQGSERGLEYDTISGRYAEFVEHEVLPRVMQETGVRLTRDPEGRASMGGSSGAAAAFTMAWFHPEWYRRVLSYSGTFVNQASPADPATPEGAWDYAAHLVPHSPRKPIRIWMEVGEKDLHFDDPEQSWHNWPLANRRMAAALKAKGYPYRFVFAQGAAHVDKRAIGQTLPGAIEWLWQGYRPKG